MKKFRVTGNVPLVGPVAVEVLAYSQDNAAAVAKAMFGGKLTVSGIFQIN